MNRMKSLSALIGSFFLLHGTAPASDAKQDRQEKIRKSKQYRDGKFRNVVEFPMIQGSYMGMFKELIFGKQVRVPTSPLPQMPKDSLNFGEPPQELQVVWLGHSTLLLEVEGKRFLVDPVLGSHAAPLPVFAKRFQPPLLTREQLPRIDAILISHDHYDHLEKETMEFYAHKGIPIYVPIGVGGHLEEWGVDAGSIHELDWWEEADFHGIRLVCTPSQHFSGRGLTDRAKTLWASWAVIGKGHRVYYSGDGGYADHFKTIGDRLGPFDLTLMENGAYDKRWPHVHMFPEEVVKAHRELNGKTLMPVHWGMFSLANHDWFEPVRRLSTAAKKDEARLLTPKLGQPVRPKENQVFEAWWEPEAAPAKTAAVFVTAESLQGAVR